MSNIIIHQENTIQSLSEISLQIHLNGYKCKTDNIKCWQEAEQVDISYATDRNVKC